ncbi:hypothetical protein FOZG_08034 [Fusarium oxysporum Fo47]|uniref:Uncharacterized protein n=1 Tax=Fusarium oxysporum Fo47 TaxID=660027 RepID=W9KG07_FUSOX|nr:hypothetical protein FOZG_08034 [Fusarium oxysporum Fo47]
MGLFSRTEKTAEQRLADNAILVGAEIAAALPNTDRPWWKQAHLLRLNALLGICCLSAATVGYDDE